MTFKYWLTIGNFVKCKHWKNFENRKIKFESDHALLHPYINTFAVFYNYSLLCGIWLVYLFNLWILFMLEL